MGTGLWKPAEAPQLSPGVKALNIADISDLLEYVRQDKEMPRKEYEQLTFLLTHINLLEKELGRVSREKAGLKQQIARMTPAYEAEMWREPYSGPVQQGQL